MTVADIRLIRLSLSRLTFMLWSSRSMNGGTSYWLNIPMRYARCPFVKSFVKMYFPRSNGWVYDREIVEPCRTS